MQRAIISYTAPLLVGAALVASGCHKRQQSATSPPPSTAQETRASEQVAAAKTESESDVELSKPQQILNDANALLMGIQDPVQKAALEQWVGQSRAVLVFPNVRKAAFLVGGRGGRGVMLARQSDGSFGSPAFYSIGGGSVGLQIGYERSSVLLFITSDKALRSAMDGGFELGTSASVALGTITDSGRAASGTAGADIISVVLDNDGVFAGASINGAVLDPHGDLNRTYYGSSDARSILTTNQFSRDRPAALTRTLNQLASG